ncbi:MAG: hypothetical protein WA476_07440 [Acidobacteriaceae bacterium]
MPDPDPPLGLLIFGVGVIFLAVVYTCTVVYTCIGKVSDHSFGWVKRARDPKGFWLTLAVYYLVGLSFVGFYLYKIHAFSN